MHCDDSRKLIHREVDGMATPEEEACLATHTATCEPCSEEQALQLRMHDALSASPKPVCPPGLGRRIADRILEGGRVLPMPASRRFGWPRARSAALIVLTAMLAGFGGWILGDGIQEAQADVSWEVQELEDEARAWRELLGADAESARAIAEIKLRYRDRLKAAGPEWARVNAEMEGEVLRAMSPELREHYRERLRLSVEEVQRSMRGTGR